MKISIIGAGNMGGAVARGLASGSLIPASDICIANPSPGKLDALKSDFPALRTTQNNREAVRGADLIILAVKPWKIRDVIDEIKPELIYSRQSIASMAAGIGTDQLCEWLDQGDGQLPGVYYLIPNTAIARRCSMTFISSAHRNAAQDAELLAVFRELGDAMFVDEQQMNACMALASCGIAYVMRYIRAATEGGVELGLRPDEARRIIMQTMLGAVSLLEVDGSHPEAEIDKVTTPGGLTIRGLNAMEESGFTAAVIRGLRASVR